MDTISKVRQFEAEVKLTVAQGNVCAGDVLDEGVVVCAHLPEIESSGPSVECHCSSDQGCDTSLGVTLGRLRIDRIAQGAGLLVDGDGLEVLKRCHLAMPPMARTVGLLGTRDLAVGEGVWIRRCGSVHTMGMAVAIDVAFLDAADGVLRVVSALGPRRMARQRGATSVVESTAGSLSGLRVGDKLTLRMSH